MKKNKIVSMILASGLLLSVVSLFSGGFYKIYPNFHTVVQEEFYRSGRLNKRELEQIVRVNGIKTIINIKEGGDYLSKTEYSFCQNNNIDYVNVPLGMKPDKEDINLVMSTVLHAKKPVLVHCRVGADRTGLISAIYLTNSGVDAKEAKKQLSIRYLHLQCLYPQFERAFENYIKKE